MKRLPLLAALAAATLAAAPVRANTVHRPGLVQMKFTQPSDFGFKTQTSGVPVLASNLVALASANGLGADLDFTPAVFMDYNAGNGPAARQNPISGTSWGWYNWTVYAYEGEIWLEAGTTLQCYGRFDDGEALVVDGKTVVFQGAGSGYNGAPTLATSYTAATTGWVPLNAWIWDWTGGKTPVSAVYALQWNTNGVTDSQSTAAKWFRFEDALDMRFLRSTTGEAFTTVGTVAKDGDDLAATLVCAGLPSSAALYGCFGSADGGNGVTGVWDHVVSLGTVATNGEASVSVSVTVPGAASARAVRFFLEGESGTTGFFTEWTEPVALTADPIVVIDSVAPSYTNGVATVNLLALGVGNTEAAVTLEIAASETGFADPVAVFPLASNPATSAGVFEMPFHGLATNATYWARAVATTADGRCESAPVAFTTLSPGAPAAAIKPVSVSFSTLTFNGTASSLGTGGTSVSLWLELSESGAFDDTISVSGGAFDAAPAALDLAGTGLRNGTTYAARIRVRNDWGLEALSETLSATTRLEPFRMSSVSTAAGAAAGTETIAIHCTDVEPETSYDVQFTVDGNTVRTFSGETATKGFEIEWAGETGRAHTVVVTVRSTVAGVDYVREYAETFRIGSNHFVVADPTAHASAAAALRLRVGDTITLPEPAANQSFRVLHDRFLSLSGNVLTALEPAVAGVEFRENNELVSTIAVLILPEAIEGGDVYIYDETSSTKDLWNRATTWEKVGATENDSWPSRPNDVAVIPFYDTTGDRYLRHETDLSLGGILFGQFRDASAGVILERHSSVGTKTLTFKRTDGEPAFVKVTPNTTSERNNTLRFGGFAIVLGCVSPVETDAGSNPSDASLNRGFITYNSCTVNIPAGSYWVVDGLPGYGLNMGGTIGAPTLTGEGTFWKKGMGGITMGNQTGFYGTVLDSSHGNIGDFNRAGPIFWHGGGGGTNVSAAIAGYVYPQVGNPSVSKNGYGWFKTGWDPAYNSDGPSSHYIKDADGTVVSNGNAAVIVPWNPRKTMTMHGGCYEASTTENTGWGVGVRNPRIYEGLDIEAGFSYISVGDGRSNNSGHPINYVEYGALSHADKGTLCLYDGSRRSVAATASGTNDMVVIRNVPASELVGAEGDCRESDIYPIIPWAVSPTTTDDSNWRNTMFLSFEPDGRLTRPVWNNTALDAAASPFSNAYLWDKTIEIGADVTLNSLFMNNSGKNKWLGEGRTLTLTSGGLVLHNNNTAIGLPGRTDNGSLVLGDADHPGYVFAKATSETGPNQIWADVTAPGGFVSSYPGRLVLGGDQTKIAGELVVNAGVLTLGSAALRCDLAKDLPVRVCAGAALAVPRDGNLRGHTVLLDGAAGQYGTIDLADGVAEKCKKLFLRDWPTAPEWHTLSRGVWGSSASSAEHIDDALFSGTGTLQVMSDDNIDPTILLVR